MTFDEWRTATEASKIIHSPPIVSARKVWQASRESQREYQGYEYCQDVECRLASDKMCKRHPTLCFKSTKELYLWLKENGYRIVKD